jgi:hypothetical protein
MAAAVCFLEDEGAGEDLTGACASAGVGVGGSGGKAGVKGRISSLGSKGSTGRFGNSSTQPVSGRGVDGVVAEFHFVPTPRFMNGEAPCDGVIGAAKNACAAAEEGRGSVKACWCGWT